MREAQGGVIFFFLAGAVASPPTMRSIIYWPFQSIFEYITCGVVSAIHGGRNAFGQGF